jgi:hypothetical protein
MPYLTELETLNAYGNDISNLQGIGCLSVTPVRDINFGCNKISTIPLEVRKYGPQFVTTLEG